RGRDRRSRRGGAPLCEREVTGVRERRPRCRGAERALRPRRRLVSRLELSLFPGSVVEAPADTILVPVPEDERPLRGGAGLVDWRLCGRISEQLRSGYVSGQLGEAALLPGARPLSPARLLLVGVGSAPARGGSRPILRAMRSAAGKLLMMRSPAALLALP